MKYGELESIKDQIIESYQEDKFSIRQISKKYGCSFSGVKSLLKRHNVKRRNKCASLNLCPEKFTNQELQILIGSILGDGALCPLRGPDGESQFYEGHCYRQIPYLRWKYNELRRFIGCKIYPLKHKLENGTIATTYNFLTRKSKLFTELRRCFYDGLMTKNASKKIDIDLVRKNLTSLSLSVWMMDDGHRPSKNTFTLYSQSYTKEDNTILKSILKTKFDLNFEVTSYINGTGWILKLRTKEEIDKLRILSSPYFLDCMRYKIS